MQALSAQGTTYSLDYWSLSEIKSVISILPQNRNVAGGLQLSVRGVLSLHQKQMKGTYGFIGEFSYCHPETAKLYETFHDVANTGRLFPGKGG